MPAGAKPAVFLDRDGVLNEAVLVDGRPHPPRDVTQLKIIDGVRQALEQLQACGFELIVVTNQPDIARKKATREDVDKINSALQAALPIDAVYVCPHDDDECDCRKPKTGMVDQAVAERNIALAGSVVVGDRWRDIELGQSAGLSTVFIDYGYSEKRPADFGIRVGHIAEAVEWMCKSLNN